MVAADSEEKARELVGNNSLAQLLADRVVVEIKQVSRKSRRGFPMSPPWAMTLHKVQGATLPEAILQLGGMADAHFLYMALSRVTELEKLWILGYVDIVVFEHPLSSKCGCGDEKTPKAGAKNNKGAPH